MQPLTLTLLQIFSVAQKRVAEQTRTGEKPVLWAWFEGSPVPGWRDDGWQAWAGPTCVLRSRGSPCCPRGSVRPRTGGQACCARPWGGKRGSGRGDLVADNLTAQPRANEVGSLQFQWKRLRPADQLEPCPLRGAAATPPRPRLLCGPTGTRSPKSQSPALSLGQETAALGSDPASTTAHTSGPQAPQAQGSAAAQLSQNLRGWAMRSGQRTTGSRTRSKAAATMNHSGWSSSSKRPGSGQPCVARPRGRRTQEKVLGKVAGARVSS